MSVTTFAKALRSCNGLEDLPKAKHIHATVLQSHVAKDRFLRNLVVEMYGKCGSLQDACRAFEEIEHRNAFSWSAMITAYARAGHLDEALLLFDSMAERDTLIWNTILSVYANARLLLQAKSLFDKIPARDAASWNTMLSAYAREGHLELAEALFYEMPDRTVASWNTMIVAYRDGLFPRTALGFFLEMDQEGFQPSKITFVAVIDACASREENILDFGVLVHEEVCSCGLEFDVPIGTALIKMYGNCGEPRKALSLFYKMPCTNSVTWNTAMAIHARNGDLDEAYKLLQQMPRASVMSWNVFLGFCACAVAGNLDRAQEVFEKMAKRDVVSWTTMISMYSRHDRSKDAVNCFKAMDLEGIHPDKIAFMAVIEACTALPEAKLVSDEVSSSGMELDVDLAAALIELYGKCGSLDDAKRFFQRARSRNSSSRIKETNLWNSFLAALVRCKADEEAVVYFFRMLLEGIAANETTLVTVFDACSASSSSSSSSLTLLRNFQETIVKRAFFAASVVIATALVRTYGKMGSLPDAAKTFDELVSSSKNLVSWTVMTAAYAQLGQPGQALGHFHEMLLRGIVPDDAALTTILSGCSHSGLLDESFRLFSMKADFGVDARIEHYVCVLDLLGRTGQLREAELLINSREFARLGDEANDRAWTAFLGACRDFGDVSRGATAAKRAFCSDPENAGPYMLLSDVCLNSR